jgi:hypothetical protein
MKARILSKSKAGVKLEVYIPYGNSMLEGEELVQTALNEAGCLASETLLKQFDTDGSAIVIGGRKLTSKGEEPKKYQSPYGEIVVERHVYQGTSGGATYVPLEERARIILTSTPKFAKVLSSKYSDLPVSAVMKDLGENHGRKVSRSLVQDTSEYVSAGIISKADEWTYELPKFEKKVAAIGVGLDGAMLNVRDEGWREGMVGSLTLYDAEGERLSSVYLAAPPEYGKEKFLGAMDKKISLLSEKFPEATKVAVADGARCNWSFLNERTDVQVLDFYHASEYVTKASESLFPKSKKQQKEWCEQSCHKLKHNKNGASSLLKEIRQKAGSVRSISARKILASVISYFKNNLKRMSYREKVEQNLPIGSGVTEAAAKTIIKQRLCLSGMRWLNSGVKTILTLRTMAQSGTNWTQFWAKVSQYGFPKFETFSI